MMFASLLLAFEVLVPLGGAARTEAEAAPTRRPT